MQERSKIKQLFFGDIDDYAWWLIGLFLFTLLLTPILTRYVIDFEIEAISFSVYFVLYVLHYRKKESNTLWDKIKVLYSLLLLIVLIQDSYFPSYGELPMFIGYFTFFAMYYIDRIVLHAPKWLSYSLNGISILVTVFFMVFAFLKTDEALKETMAGDLLRIETTHLKEQAEREAANAREAEARAFEALKELENCNNQ